MEKKMEKSFIVANIILGSWLENMIKKKANDVPFLSVMYLFYDEYDKQNVELHPINFI